MPFEMSWYATNRVVYEKLSGFVSLDEIHSVLRLGEQYQEQARNQVVHFIADISELHALPLTIIQLRNIELKPPPQKGMTAVVSSPSYSVNSVATFFGKAHANGLWFPFFKCSPRSKKPISICRMLTPACVKRLSAVSPLAAGESALKEG